MKNSNSSKSLNCYTSFCYVRISYVYMCLKIVSCEVFLPSNAFLIFVYFFIFSPASPSTSSATISPLFKKQESELDFDPCPLCVKRTPVEGRFQPCGHALFCYEHADTFKACPTCKVVLLLGSFF